jgi:LuxR family transcriptional regulator, maltose regulon positive regulatory protein
MERPLQQEAEQIALARIRIADQRSEQALPSLDAVLAEAHRGDRQLHVVQALGLRALALRHSEQAFSCLERALSIAAPEGFVRLFVDEGEAMRQLLERFVSNRTASPMRSYAAQLVRAFAGVTAAHMAAAQGLTEPLSDRELEVLGLMASGLTNADIADRLYLSVATVKKHGTNIFGKLGVINRQEAVARAQELRLIR